MEKNTNSTQNSTENSTDNKTEDITKKDNDTEMKVEEKKISEINLQKICNELLDECVLKLESKDNVSVIIILFNPF